MQEEDGLSTTKEAAGKSQGNGHKSQRQMAADPVLWIGVLCSSTSMCCGLFLGFWLHANKIHTQRFFALPFHALCTVCQCSDTAKGTQRTWEVEVSLAQTTLPPPSLLPLFQVRVFRQFLVFVFYAYCLQCVFICLLCAIPSILTIFDQLGCCFCVCWYVFDFYAATTLYFQISSLPLLLPFSCAAIITLMCATVIQGCISCGILVSGIGARGVSSEHMENMEMFSCSPT